MMERVGLEFKASLPTLMGILPFSSHIEEQILLLGILFSFEVLRQGLFDVSSN